MGLFDKLLKGADKVYGAKTTLETEAVKDARVLERTAVAAAPGGTTRLGQHRGGPARKELKER